MSTPHIAERLIILCDLSHGVLTRLYSLIDYKRPALFAPKSEIEQFAKLMIKKFPEFSDALNKEKSNEVFKKRSSEIQTELYPYYATMIELCNFMDETQKLLQEIVASQQDMKFDINLDIMSYFFTLFTRYISCFYLLNLIECPQLYLASYARAYHHTSGNTDKDYGRISKLIINYHYEDGYINEKHYKLTRKLQEDNEFLSLRLGEICVHFLPFLMKFQNTQSLLAQKNYNFLEETKHVLNNNNDKDYIVLLHLDKIKTWILWSFLICPGELQRSDALELLKLALKDSFALTLFRDKTINIYREYDEVFEEYKNGKFKLNKHKKLLTKEVYPEHEEIIKTHADMRVYLMCELENLHHFFTDLPSCIPSKFILILSLLHLTREEIVWYFKHLHIIPYKCSNSKYKGLGFDHVVAQLIFWCVEFFKIIEQYKSSIQSFYLDYLVNVDLTPAQAAAQKLLQAHPSTSLQSMVQSVLDSLQNKTINDNYEAIRLNWYRISAYINSATSAIPIHSATEFSNCLNTIVTHSRHIDCIDTQLKIFCSFSTLYFYRNDVQNLLTEVLKGQVGGVDIPVSSVWSFVSILNSGLQNIHRLYPEEQPLVGREVVTFADAWIRLIVGTMDRSVKSIIADSQILRSKTNHNAVIQRIAQLQAAAAQAAPNSPPPTLPEPGDESHYDNRAILANLSLQRRIVTDICSNIYQSPLFVVYNIEFSAREYVYETIQSSIRATLLNLCVQGSIIQKPSVILNRLKDTIYAYQSIERTLNINVSDIVKDVLLSEFSGEAPSADPSNADAPSSLIYHIASFYANLFQQDLSMINIVYSSLKRCFISRKVGNSSQHNNQLEFERYTDVSELRALITMIGVNGVLLIDRALLRVVTKHFKTVKDVLISNQGVLQILQNRFSEQNVWAENYASLINLDQLCQATTIIGCILQFRVLLKDSLEWVISSRLPLVHRSISLAYNQLHDSVHVDARLAPLDQLAHDVGMDVGESDHALKIALSSFKTSVSDMALFNLLPEMFGMMYLSPRWKQAAYMIETEGHSNNNHTMALAIRQFLVQFNRIQIKEGAVTAEIERRIQFDLERFVKCSAFTILHMSAFSKDPNMQYPLSAIMIFLEQFINAVGGNSNSKRRDTCNANVERMELGYLEQCFPFTILRTNYLQLYEKQTPHSYAPVADESND